MQRSAFRDSIILVIPCHRPSPDLPRILSQVMGDPHGPQAGVIVDDGNGPEAEPILDRLAAIPRVTLLRHAVNMGVGAALKTALQHVLLTWPEAAGVVAADADGQHAARDIVRVSIALRQNPGCVILGTRRFQKAPWRSRFGNEVTAVLFRWLARRPLSDTQTGLRGWPLPACARNVKLRPNGFEYQLECLLVAKEPFLEVPIETIYLDGNKSSHFKPITDSLRIYYVLLRYCHRLRHGCNLLRLARLCRPLLHRKQRRRSCNAPNGKHHRLWSCRKIRRHDDVHLIHAHQERRQPAIRDGRGFAADRDRRL
jgi:hypothetical protein